MRNGAGGRGAVEGAERLISPRDGAAGDVAKVATAHVRVRRYPSLGFRGLTLGQTTPNFQL